MQLELLEYKIDEMQVTKSPCELALISLQQVSMHSGYARSPLMCGFLGGVPGSKTVVASS
jgi:hypothetical protein